MVKKLRLILAHAGLHQISEREWKRKIGRELSGQSDEERREPGTQPTYLLERQIEDENLEQ